MNRHPRAIAVCLTCALTAATAKAAPVILCSLPSVSKKLIVEGSATRLKSRLLERFEIQSDKIWESDAKAQYRTRVSLAVRAA